MLSSLTSSAASSMAGNYIQTMTYPQCLFQPEIKTVPSTTHPWKELQRSKQHDYSITAWTSSYVKNQKRTTRKTPPVSIQNICAHRFFCAHFDVALIGQVYLYPWMGTETFLSQYCKEIIAVFKSHMNISVPILFLHQRIVNMVFKEKFRQMAMVFNWVNAYSTSGVSISNLNAQKSPMRHSSWMRCTGLCILPLSAVTGTPLYQVRRGSHLARTSSGVPAQYCDAFLFAASQT